jgi:HK97 family phage major capsid protein
MSTQVKELYEKAKALYDEAMELQASPDLDAQSAERRDGLLKECLALRGRALKFKEAEEGLKELENYGSETKETKSNDFRSAGHWIAEMAKYYDQRTRMDEVHPTFRKENEFKDAEEDRAQDKAWVAQKSQRKDLVENAGQSGGFLVPVEFRPQLLAMIYEDNPIRSRATKIPMRRRQMDIPTLDQTGTTAGQSRQFGGIIATWTEEATSKPETEPKFRKIQMVAHKLTCYTEASDEMLADDAVGMVAVLSGPMGWAGAIRWEEEYTFLRGTGDGQPLGVLNAGATHVEPRVAAGAIGVTDLFNMLSHHQGENPTWHIARSAMPQILNLNGPAGNPSYVWITSARDRMPMSLFGYPVDYTEKLPALGASGDILLSDWSYYLIGDRQSITIDSSQHFRFRSDLTAWRAVHRVDGQPWLTSPITLADGAWQISPFVILDAAAAT